MPWSHRITQIEGRPSGVLIDDRFRASSPVRELPHLAWIGVYCRLDSGGGFWHPDETASLDSIEQDLVRLAEQFGRGWVVYVMRIDTPGLREYYFYCGENAAISHALPSLRAAHPDYRIQFEETVDAEWSRYRTFLRNHEPSA
jgi:hypothetical protein